MFGQLGTTLNRLQDHWMIKFFVAEVAVETTEFYPIDEVIEYMNRMVARYTEVCL